MSLLILTNQYGYANISEMDVVFLIALHEIWKIHRGNRSFLQWLSQTKSSSISNYHRARRLGCLTYWAIAIVIIIATVLHG